MKKETGFTINQVLVLLLGIVICGGWIANIVKIFGADLSHFTGIIILRVVGVFVAPLGVVLGFL